MCLLYRMNNSVPVPVTIINGYLGAGKTTIILNMLKYISQTYHVDYDDNSNSGDTDSNASTGIQTPAKISSKYRVVWLKNEFGVNEVDSILAEQSAISSVKEILNGCLCCTLVGKLSDAIGEILATVPCDRIVIETSGSAYPAPLAQEINRVARGIECAPKLNVCLDGVICVIDAANFAGYEDTSPTARIQARYTDLLVLNKVEQAGEARVEHVTDLIADLNPETNIVKTIQGFVHPEVVFGLDRKLYTAAISNDTVIHARDAAGAAAESFASDVDVLHAEWLTLAHPRTLARPSDQELVALMRPAGSTDTTSAALPDAVRALAAPLPFTQLAASLDMLASNDVIRAKGVIFLSGIPRVQLSFPEGSADAAAQDSDGATFTGAALLNWAFGRYTLTPIAVAREDAAESPRVTGTLPRQALTPSTLFTRYSGVDAHARRGAAASHVHGTAVTSEATPACASAASLACVHSRLTLMGVSVATTMLPFKLAKQIPVRKLAKPFECKRVCAGDSDGQCKFAHVDACVAHAKSATETHPHDTSCAGAADNCCATSDCADHTSTSMVITPAVLVSLVGRECVRPGLIVGVSGSHSH